MDKELIEYLKKMEERMNRNFENALKPIKEQLDETNEIVKSVLHGQELSSAKIELIEKSMR